MKKKFGFILLGSFVFAASVFAQTTPQQNLDIRHDERDIRHDNRDIRHDRKERNEDLKDGKGTLVLLGSLKN